jgi:thiamine kinase-like enzyme
VTAEDITSAWLGAVLGRDASGSSSPPDVTRIGARYGFASEVYRVSQDLHGQPSSLVIKLWSTEGPGGVREVSFYRDFGAEADVRLPTCHHAALDPEAARGVLVLEDVCEGVQGDCLETVDIESAGTVADQMARLHARWWNSSRLSHAGWMPSVRTYSREPDWFEERRTKFSERFPERLHPACRSLFETAQAVVQESNELLSALPETLLHGDLHLDNIVFEPDVRAVILDWARVARGPAALDLCDVMLMVRPDDQPAILDLYVNRLRMRGVDASDREMARGVAGAMLRKFIVCTSGLTAWYPPSPREERVLYNAMARAQEAVLAWKNQRPESFVPERGATPSSRTAREDR